jgi:dTDP-4-amino-4,6-dideoxygalactose transaminase
MKIPFFKFECTAREVELVTDVLRSGWLTTAGKAAEFEANFRKRCNSDYAFAVNSCTAALHLALEAIGVGPGDKVVVPSLTFTATAEVVRYLGADPVFVDVDYSKGFMTSTHLVEALAENPDIKACIAVHFAGQSVAMDGDDGLWTMCQQHGIRLVLDAAHAFPAFDSYGPVGSLGDVTCFSFYANKTITTGEGGMLVTNDPQIAERVRVMRLHGINRDVWDRFTNSKSSWEYDVVAPGYKYNMPDVNAAIGLAQLERADEFRDERQRCAQRYLDVLRGVEEIDLLHCRVNPEHHSWHLFPIVIKPEARVERNDVIRHLNDRGIGTSVHYKPLHRMSYYRDTYQLKASDFPSTEQYWAGCLSLPLYPSLTDGQIDFVVEQVLKSL